MEISTLKIRQTLSGEFKQAIAQITSVESIRPNFASEATALFQKLTFSHFVELHRLEDPVQSAFYEIECSRSGWSVWELKCEMGSLRYERLGLSTDKEKLLRLTSEETPFTKPADLIKDPYIFEFLGLTPKEAFREQDLKTALFDQQNRRLALRGIIKLAIKKARSHDLELYKRYASEPDFAENFEDTFIRYLRAEEKSED